MVFFGKGSFINFKNVASKVIHLNPPNLYLQGTQPKERKQKTSPGLPTGYQSIDYTATYMPS